LLITSFVVVFEFYPFLAFHKQVRFLKLDFGKPKIGFLIKKKHQYLMKGLIITDSICEEILRIGNKIVNNAFCPKLSWERKYRGFAAFS